MELIAKYLEWVEITYMRFKATKHLFFRGHEDNTFTLLPSVLREPSPGKVPFKEKEIFLDFKQYAPAHAIDYDFASEKDKLLVDMQHYEVPTRLLDWTVAPLNALFFACLDSESKNGQVIALDPWDYWKELVRDKDFPEIHQIHISARSLLASGWKFKHIKGYVERRFGYSCLEEPDLIYPFPFVATFTNDRIIHQRGCFTIHGTSAVKMEDSPTKDVITKYMERFDIPGDQKSKYLKELNKLYINHYSVYPDFQGMQATIKEHNGLFNI